MPNENSYNYTSTPIAYGPSGEIIPSFTPKLDRYRDPEEVEAVSLGQMPAVEAGTLNMGRAATIALGVLGGFLLGGLLGGRS